MTNTLYDKPDDIDRMTRRNHELCADLAEVRAEARELKGALQKSAERIQLVVKSYDEKVAEIHGMKEQLAAARREHDKVLLEHKRYYIAEIVQLRDELADANSALEKAVAELAKEKELSSTRSVSHENNIASIASDNRELRIELADSSNALEKTVAELAKLQAELDVVRAKKRRLAMEIAPMQDQTELANKNWALHIELCEVRDKLAEMESGNRSLYSCAQEAAQEAGDLCDELADANSALEKAVAELGILAPYVTAGLLPALDACGSVLLYGQKKYPANDWADICPEEHNAAILRHMGSKTQYDHESEQLHSAHVAARALMALGTELPYAQD